MELMKGTLARQNHVSDTGEFTGPAIEIKVDKATTGKIKPLVATAQLMPDRCRHAKAVTLAVGEEKARCRRATETGDIKQTIAISRSED